MSRKILVCGCAFLITVGLTAQAHAQWVKFNIPKPGGVGGQFINDVGNTIGKAGRDISGEYKRTVGTPSSGPKPPNFNQPRPQSSGYKPIPFYNGVPLQRSNDHEVIKLSTLPSRQPAASINNNAQIIGNAIQGAVGLAQIAQNRRIMEQNRQLSQQLAAQQQRQQHYSQQQGYSVVQRPQYQHQLQYERPPQQPQRFVQPRGSRIVMQPQYQQRYQYPPQQNRVRYVQQRVARPAYSNQGVYRNGW